MRITHDYIKDGGFVEIAAALLAWADIIPNADNDLHAQLLIRASELLKVGAVFREIPNVTRRNDNANSR